jgi:TIR domain
LPVHRRPFEAFLSHAHVDRAFVDELYRFLEEEAGLHIWYDAKRMTGGQDIFTGLQTAIQECRGMLLVASPEAITRGWVKRELNVAGVEQSDHSDFRIVPLQVGGADLSSLIEGQSWIPVPDSTLNANVAAAILSALYPGDDRPDPRTSRDVYLSGSWRADDMASALAVSRSLCKSGFRLIGDSKDQKGFKSDRIKSIIESCGAFVSVIPYRDKSENGVPYGDKSELASAGDPPYKYFITEIDLAKKADLPSLVIADPRIRRSDGDDNDWIRMDTLASACPPAVQNAIEALWDRWISPPVPHQIFLAVDFDLPAAKSTSDVRLLIERITGMRTIVGNEIQEADIQSAILQSIKRSFLVIADLSGTSDDTFNLDVCIEAGIAFANDTNLALFARGKPRSPPFMLRRAGQMSTYADAVEQLAVLHRIVRDYRRRVINAELQRY